MEDTPRGEVVNYAAFCGKVLKLGWHAITLVEFYMIVEWIEAFTLNGIVVMPYLYTFIYYPKTVLRRYIAGFSINTVQYAVLAQSSGVQIDGFVLQFGNTNTLIESPFITKNAII